MIVRAKSHRRPSVICHNVPTVIVPHPDIKRKSIACPSLRRKPVKKLNRRLFDCYHNLIIFGVYLFKKILIPQAHNLLTRLTAKKERVVQNIQEVVPAIVNNIKRWVKTLETDANISEQIPNSL